MKTFNFSLLPHKQHSLNKRLLTYKIINNNYNYHYGNNFFKNRNNLFQISNLNYNVQAIQHIMSTFNPKLSYLFLGLVGGAAFNYYYDHHSITDHEKRLKKQARKGDDEAQFAYGELLLQHINNNNIESKKKKKKIYSTAFQYFSMAAEQGNQKAHYYLGLLHKENKIDAASQKAAFHHFSIASQDIHEDTQHDHQSSSKNKIKKSSTSNDEYYKSCAKYQLALCYLEGIGCNKDISAGINLLKEATHANADAAYYLSDIYSKGLHGIHADQTQAMSWKLEASLLGNKQASKDLSILYEQIGKERLSKNALSNNNEEHSEETGNHGKEKTQTNDKHNKHH